jgi:hypothetical protein
VPIYPKYDYDQLTEQQRDLIQEAGEYALAHRQDPDADPHLMTIAKLDDLFIHLSIKVHDVLDVIDDHAVRVSPSIRQWMLNRILEILLVDRYAEWVAKYESETDLKWDRGKSPYEKGR